MPEDPLAIAIARSLLDLWGSPRQSTGIEVPDMAAASRVIAAVRSLREARGERVAGRKIGFSNTTIWPIYGVDRPIWNYVWDTTLVSLPGAEGAVGVSGFPEPRIEPEIVFHLAMPPEPGMDDGALFACIDRVTHGFEIVQSVFPGWAFTAPQSAAAFGLHGALVVGPWHAIDDDRRAWFSALTDFTVELRRDGVQIATGHARNVLGGPLRALRHLVEALAGDPLAAPLAAGEIVSTGTLTDAFPVTIGSEWVTGFDGIGVNGLRVTCT